uniref:Uncharacterized protein n=1 Tax=Anguilla anguilla TaxID=7936 RepID=A0A0E9T235_ANGAN
MISHTSHNCCQFFRNLSLFRLLHVYNALIFCTLCAE